MLYNEKVDELLMNHAERLNNLTRCISLAKQRIANLIANDFYIEAIIVSSQILEYTIVTILKAFEMRENIEVILGSSQRHTEFSKLSPDIENKPLGVLIDELSKYVGPRSLLTEDLNIFKEEMRDVSVHKAFLSKDEFDVANLKAKEYIGSLAVNKLFDLLLDEDDKVVKRIQKIDPRYSTK